MIKYLSISELEEGKPTDPIWAINTSSTSDVQAVGEVHISIPKINGSKIDPLHIPQTWLAIELTKVIPRAQLLAAAEFRMAIANNLIRVISAKSAEEINSQEGATEEMARLAELRKYIRSAGAARTVTAGIGDITMVGGNDDADPSAAKVEAKSALSDNFMMFADNLQLKTDIECLNAIKSRRTFSRKELQHLKKLLNDKPKTSAILEKQLNSK